MVNPAIQAEVSQFQGVMTIGTMFTRLHHSRLAAPANTGIIASEQRLQASTPPNV